MDIKIESDLDEIFRLLQESDMNPRLCSTPVPCYDASIQAGLPTSPGDITTKDSIRLPDDIAINEAMYIADVKGDSMRDVGIMPGDQLLIQRIDNPAIVNDGDAVIAWIEGQCTVKALFRDEYGDAWLVPRNSNYEPILVTEDTKITGKVIKCLKNNLTSSHADIIGALRKARKQKNKTAAPSNQTVAKAIRHMSDYITKGRLWFAVYRAIVDSGALQDSDFSTFANLVSELLPEHPCLPVATEMRRMNVQSFRKPLSLWERLNAPVSGSRFDEYFRIALETKERLEG